MALVFRVGQEAVAFELRFVEVVDVAVARGRDQGGAEGRYRLLHVPSRRGNTRYQSFDLHLFSTEFFQLFLPLCQFSLLALEHWRTLMFPSAIGITHSLTSSPVGSKGVMLKVKWMPSFSKVIS